MEIHIKTIPHSQQRYETVGDYWYDRKGILQIRVSKMDTSISEQLVAVHELVEVIMCLHKGVKISDIDKFDNEFEAKRKKGNNDEPGFDRNAPYRNEHAIATAVELIMCGYLDVPWQEHELQVNFL